MRDEIVRLRDAGMTYQAIADKLNSQHGTDHTDQSIRGIYRRATADHKQRPDYNLAEALKKGVTLDTIADRADVSERVARAMIDDLAEQGLCIDEQDGVYRVSNVPHGEVQTVNCDWRGDKIIRFGVVSDNHLGSHFTQITLLHEAYRFFKAEGIADVYNPGDLTEGENMRPGHAYECYIHGADAHTDEVIRNYPRVDGITTHCILGNHDASFVKHVGLDISRTIAKERPDMRFLGMDQAYIHLTPNCMLELRHPGGGSAYAISYKPQKIIESMSGGEKPNILLLGHFHKAEYIPYRNVHCVQAGTTQAQSNFMRNHNLAAYMGYWLIEIHVNDDGQINRFKPEFMQCYRAIKDDWQSYR